MLFKVIFKNIKLPTFYNEIFSSVERFIVSNRSQIKVSKCNLYDINFISLDDFEVRRILSTHRMNRKLKSYLQVVATVEAKGKNQYGYESEDGEIWMTVSVSYRLEDGLKEFIAEWRCFVLDGRVLDVRPYTGDYHAQFDPSVIDKAISCWKDAPIAYGLDIGVTRDGRTLVEVNDGYALRNYGLSPLNSINFHKAR